jgi:Uncharacterized protein conserved in bacteria (DUF2188)
MANGDIHTRWDGKKWINKAEGGQRPSNSGTRKEDVQSKGREMAIERGVEHIIHKKERNKIQERNGPYPPRHDPRKSKG